MTQIELNDLMVYCLGRYLHNKSFVENVAYFSQKESLITVLHPNTKKCIYASFWPLKETWEIRFDGKVIDENVQTSNLAEILKKFSITYLL